MKPQLKDAKRRKKKNFIVLRFFIIVIIILSLSFYSSLLIKNYDPSNIKQKESPKELGEQNISSGYDLDVTFLYEEAGISIYTNYYYSLNLAIAKNAFKYIEKETEDFIVGSVELSGHPEHEEVHCFVHKKGLIITYYLKNEPVSKIIDWYNIINIMPTKSKLYIGLSQVCLSLGLNINEYSYYHFQYPNSNKLTLIFDWQNLDGTDTFLINIPDEFLIYERSYSHSAGEDSDTFYSLLSSTQLTQGRIHTIEALVTYYYDWWSSSWDSYYKIDGTIINHIADKAISRVGLCLVYHESATSAKLTIQYANSSLSFTLFSPFLESTSDPLIDIKMAYGGIYSFAPTMNIDFFASRNLLAAYYKIDTYWPCAWDISGWTPIFMNPNNKSYTMDITVNSSIWNSLNKGGHTVYFKVWDIQNNINDGLTPNWFFYKEQKYPEIIEPENETTSEEKNENSSTTLGNIYNSNVIIIIQMIFVGGSILGLITWIIKKIRG